MTIAKEDRETARKLKAAQKQALRLAKRKVRNSQGDESPMTHTGNDQQDELSQ